MARSSGGGEPARRSSPPQRATACPGVAAPRTPPRAAPAGSLGVGRLKSVLKTAGGGGSGGTRPIGVEGAIVDLQRTGGNRLVQRLVSWSCQPGWAGGLPVVRVDRGRRVLQRQPGAKVGDPVADQARLDLPTFQAGVYSLKNHKVGINGQFDVTYRPLAKVLDLAVRVKFDFQGKGWNVISRATSMFKFVSQAQSVWSAKHQLGNVRPPADVWGKALNPVTVRVRVVPVAANQHFIVRFHKKAGGAQVHQGVTDLFKGNLDPSQVLFNPVTAQGELARVKRINPSPVLFDHDSAAIPAGFVPKLGFLTDYLKRINNPPFTLDVKGFASSVGPEDYNKKLAERRAKAVEDHLRNAGLTNHTVSHTGIGEVPGGEGAPFRKADIGVSIPAGWQNTFSTAPHEFGHMLGLGDEYQGTAGTVASHHGLVAKHFGQAYADQTVKRGDVASGGIMHFGEEVRIHHYVTFWDALAQATAKAAVPVPPFSHADWKLLE